MCGNAENVKMVETQCFGGTHIQIKSVMLAIMIFWSYVHIITSEKLKT